MLFLPPLFDLAQRALVIPLMTLSSEVVARTAFGGVVAPIMGVFDAALGDLHATTPMVLTFDPTIPPVSVKLRIYILITH